jgi:3-methyl-2-oxobutanoate hydroxymethyltransferase
MSVHATPATAAVKLATLAELKARGERIAMLTAYDATLAAQFDACGVDALLVGDSLGMVIQGRATTLPVTLADIVYHCQAVARGLKRALLVADLPFGSYPDPATAYRSAVRLIGEGGAAMVKLERAGPVLDCIRYLIERDVPVCAHLGLTPQSVHRLGGYKVQGRDDEAAVRLQADALAVQAAGATLLVLECVPAKLARAITARLSIPTIGIGAGAGCDGQVLVSYDLLGVSLHRRPRFVRDFLAGRGDIAAAVRAYVAAVRDGSFPSADESY